MEDIEYLEEYEDLVLPALNSAAAAAAVSSVSYQTNKSAQNQKINDADDSSSSLDQDIFNCLFDDNSDDDFNEYENIDNETSLKNKCESNDYFEALDEKIDETDDKSIDKEGLSRQQQINKVNTVALNKGASSAQKNKTFITKTSGTAIALNTNSQTAFINKTKSVATVRPTVQNQHQQDNSNKKSNLLQKATSLSSSTSSYIEQQNPSTSAAVTTSGVAHVPVLVRKTLPSSSTIGKKPATSTHTSTTPFKKVTKRAATIVKPEQIISKDPPHDPLDIDDLSEAASDNDSLSDISGNTYNTISEFEDDESNDEFFSGDEDYYEDDQEGISSSSQVIELSNDSSSAPSNLEDFRAPTPSPVISDDSETRSSSLIFKISTIKSVKPYTHPDIIQSVLRKGEKPKLLDLLHKYNLLEDSLETFEEENTIIDITTSRENLVESSDTQQDESLKNNPPPTTLTVDIVNINPTDSNNPLTLNPINNNIPKSSKNTNKNKSKKKSVANMDARDLKSPGAVSTDSDLSAVEELLEESYAEAMKRVNDVPFGNQDVGAEADIHGNCEINTIVENTQDLPKAGVVINCETENTKTNEQNDLKAAEHKEIEPQIIKIDQNNKEPNEPEKLLKSETKEIVEKADVQVTQISEQTDCSLKQELTVKESVRNEVYNEQEKSLKSETKEINVKADAAISEPCSLKQEGSIKESAQNKEFNEQEKSVQSETKENNENTDVQIIAKPEKIDFCSLKHEVVKEGDNELNETEKLLQSAIGKNNENDEVKIIEISEETNSSSKQEVLVEANPQKTANDSKSSLPGCQKSANIVESVEAATLNSPNAKKKKRFRNLVTPEPPASEVAIIVDDIKDFKGFEEEEVQSNKSIEKAENQNKTIKPAKEIGEKLLKNIAEKERPPGSFKSPSNSNQSLKDKPRESKGNSARDNSRESKDKSARHSKNSRDSSKDRSSRESSRDKSSRDSSKDRSRENSKDRSKQSHNKDSASKYHHRDHRKSSDSKDSSKSRESSKSRDSKDSRNIKTDTGDSRKSTSIKRDILPESNKEKSTAKKDDKTIESGNIVKETIKSSTDSKIAKEQHNKKELNKFADSKANKNITLVKQDSNKSSTIKRDLSLERSKEKPTEHKDRKVNETDNSKKIDKSSKESNTTKEHDNKKELKEVKKGSLEKSDKMSDKALNSKEKKYDKHLTSPVKESKETHTSSPSSTKNEPNVIRDSVKEQKIKKTIDLTKNNPEIKKPDHSKSPKVSKNVNKSVINKPSTSATADNVKYSKSNENSADKKTSLSDLNTSITSSKSDESQKKDFQKIMKSSSSDSMINKIDDVNKAVNDKKQPNKIQIKPDMPTKTKNQTPQKQLCKETVETPLNKKQSEGSHTKPSYSETKDTNPVTPSAVNTQKTKTIIKSTEMKSKEKPVDFKKPKESEHAKTVETKNKDTSKISASPKRSPKPKDDSIKINEQGNLKKTIKSKQQPISKNLHAAAVPMPDKIKADEMKNKTDENKTDSSVNIVDLTIDSEKSKSSADNKEETNSESEKTVCENQPSKNPKENKANKDELKDKEIKTKDGSNIVPFDKEMEINKVTSAAIKEGVVKEREKNSSKYEQKGKLMDKNKIPETSNQEKEEEIPKNKDPSDDSKMKQNEPETEKSKIPPASKNMQSEKSTEKNIIQKNTNKERKVKETPKPKVIGTPKNDHNKRDIEKSEIPDVSSKEQKEKETLKMKEREIESNTILETLNKEQKGNESEKLPETSNMQQNKKELEKNKNPEALIKEQKGKETADSKVIEVFHKKQKVKKIEKNKTPETPSKQHKNTDAERIKVPETPNKDQKEMDIPGNNDLESSSKEQQGKEIKNKVQGTTNKELNKKEMEITRSLEIPSKDHKVKEIVKKEVPKTHNKEQSKKGIAKKKIVQETSHKEEKEIDKKKLESNKEQKLKDTPKDKVPKIFNKESIMKDANDTTNSESFSDQIAVDSEKQITTNKTKISDNKTVAQTEISSSKSAPSSKTYNNPEKQIENISKDSIKDLKETKQITEPPATSAEVKIKEISTTQKEKIESMTENIPDHSIELKPRSVSHKSGKDCAEINQSQEETKQSECNIDVTTDKKSLEIKTADLPAAILKNLESPILKKSLKYDAANESEKIRNIMESVLEKSVVVVIEPLKTIPHVNVNIEDKNPIEPRRTRSRLETPKMDDPVRKEELSTDENSEKSETKKLKFSEPSTSKDICETKPEKTENERLNTETFERKDIDLKSKEIKSDIEVGKTIRELSDICQDDSTNESKLFEGEKSIADCSKKETEKEIVGPVKTRRRGDLTQDSETDEKSEEKYSKQRETAKLFESKKPKRRTDHKREIEREKVVTPQIELSEGKHLSQNKTEADTSKSINTRSRMDLQTEMLKEEGGEKFTKEAFEEKTSASKQEKELGEEYKTENSQGLTDKFSEGNAEPRKTRRRVDMKEEALKRKLESTDIESSGVKKSAQKETDDDAEPIKSKKRSDLKTEAIKEITKIAQIVLSDEKSSTNKEIDPIKTRKRTDISEEPVKEKIEILQVEPLNSNCSASNDPIKTRSRVDLKEGLKEKNNILEVHSLEEKGSDQKNLKEHYESPKTKKHVKAETDKEKTETKQPELPEDTSSANKESEALKTRRHCGQTEAANEKSEISQVENLASVKTRRRGDLKVESNTEKTEITKVELSEEKNIKNENEPVKTKKRGDLKEETEKEKAETLQVDILDNKCSIQKELKEEHHEPIKTRSRADLKSEGGVVEISEEKSCNKKENDSVKTRTRADLREETVEKLKVVLSDSKNSDQKKLAEVNLEVPKSKKHADLKTETEKEKLHISGGKTSIQKESGKEISTPIKTKGAVKQHAEISHLESSSKTSSIQENTKKVITETITTRKRGEITNEKSSVQECEKNATQQITPRKRGDSKTETEKNQEKMVQKEKEYNFEPVTKRRRIDSKHDSGKNEEEKSFAQETTESVIVEQITTRSRGDPKRDAEKDLLETSQVDFTQKKIPDQKEQHDNFETITRRSRGDTKSEHEKNNDEKSYTDKSNETVVIEPIATRSRADPKREAEKAQLEISQVELTPKKVCDPKDPDDNFGPITTRRRGDAKSGTEKNKDEKSSTQKNTETTAVEQIITRRRGDPKVEAVKDQLETSQDESLHKKILHNKEPEDHFEHITTRRRGDTRSEAKNKNEKTSDQKNTETILVEQIITRSRGDNKGEDEKDHQEPPQVGEHFDSIATRTRGGAVLESGIDKDEMSKVESCEEKCLVQDNVKSQTEEQRFEPRKTRRRFDLKEEALKEKDELSRKDLSLDSIGKQSFESKSRIEDKNMREKSEENIKIDNCKSTEDCESLKVHIPQLDSQNQTGHKSPEPIKTRNRGEVLKPKDETSKLFSTAHEQKAVKTNIDVQKISEESVGSENEMSGCESSSSNSEHTFRRTLRNRITDSPFPENDNKKKFKEPHLMPTTFVTPKSSRNESETTAVLSSISKRTLRSPAAETESPSSSKKLKLDTSKKSRVGNLHESLEETVLPMVTSQHISKEPSYSQEQPSLDKQKLNESSTIILKKTAQNKSSIEIKETPKKVEEKVKDAKTSQASINVLRKKADNEVTKEPTGKEILDINIKQANESITNAVESTIQPVTNKANIKTTPKKPPGVSAVISFSEWLKTKNQNNADGHTVEPATTKDSTQDIVNRQNRERSRLPPKVVDSKLTEDKKGTTGIDKLSQAKEIIISQNKEQISGEIQTNSSIIDNETTSVVIDAANIPNESRDNSKLQVSDNKLEINIKELSAKIKNKKSNVKRLQASTKISSRSPKMEINKSKPITPIRHKRNETDILIASMPKEMRDRGITDLLNAEAHVKRQRLPNRRLIDKGIEQQRLNTTAAVPTTRATKEKILAASVTQVPNVNTSNKDIKKVSPLFSENLEVQTKNMSKSPTRRKQNLFTESQRDVVLTPSIEQTATPENTNTLPATSRKSGDPKGLLVQMDKESTNIATPIVVRSRKSMPVLTKETLDKVAHVPSRKSLSIPKQQKDKNELPQNSVFKMPKHAGQSNILNKTPIPSDVSIKKFYSDDIKRPESRIKIQQKENILKRFKCRKPYVRLDRSIVENYFKSMSNEEKQRLTAAKHVTSSDIIQNNNETSLRIQSVVDASNIGNTVSPITRTNKQAYEAILSGRDAFQDEIVNSTAMGNIQETYILPNMENTSTQINSATDTNEIIELKHEFMDENPLGLINDAILPDTPTLLARAQTITEAAHHALSNSVTPTDIRILATDSSENNFVPSFGVTPRSLDNKGTCLYTFLHPAKYNRNHSNVLLDYCCPNLDGPMPAIDPTRIHAQVQIPIIELPASIVLTTKVVTRSDLDNGNTTIPSIIRKKAEKIRQNMATHHKLAVTTTAGNTQSTTSVLPPLPQPPHLAPSPRPSLPPTINALTKQLPSTTTITAKIRPPITQQTQALAAQSSSVIASSVTSSISKNPTVSVMPKGHGLQLGDTQQSILRSNLRRFDVLLKQLVQPYESLSFAERHRVIEAVIASENFLPKALDQTLLLMEEYIKQTVLLKRNDALKQSPSSSTSAIMSTNNYTSSEPNFASPLVTAQMPQLQPSPKMLASNVTSVTPNTYAAQFEQMHNKKLQYRGKNTISSSAATGSPSEGVLVKQRQVPIYDTDRNVIGYQMQMVTPPTAYTKSTTSTNSGAIMSTSLDSKITSYCISKRPLKRPPQDSPRVFYTTPPLKTSTPKGIGNSDMYHTQRAKNANTIAQKTQGTIVTTVRSGGSSSSATSKETITTTTMATVKRVTRSTATGSKIIIVSKSNQSNEESILPDDNSSQQQTEIKNEKDIEEFLG